MARVIGEASVRLRVDGTGLDRQIDSTLRKAFRSIQLDTSPFDRYEKDAGDAADRTSNRFRAALNVAQRAGSSFARSMTSVFKAVAVLGAIGGAINSVSALGGVLLTAGAAATTLTGAVGVLPGLFVALQVATATVKLGLQGIGDSFKALASGDMAAFNESLKGLAPNAQSFMRAVSAFKPAFDAMKLDVQQRLFAGLNTEVQALGRMYLPVASQQFGLMAQNINKSVREATGFLQTPQALRDVTTIGENVQGMFRNMRGVLADVVQAFLDITTVGSSFLPGIGASVQGLTSRFQQFIASARESGQLQQFFAAGLQAVKDLGVGLGNLGIGLFNVFQIGQAQGAGLLATFRSLTEQFRAFTESAAGQQAIGNLFATLGEVMRQVTPIIRELALVFGQVLAPIAREVAAVIGPAVLSVIQQLGPVFQALQPGIMAVAQVFAQLLTTLAPLLPLAAQFLNAFLLAMMPVIQALLPPFTQIVQAILPQLTGLMTALGPLLAVAAQAFGQLLVALLPLLPPIIDLAMKLIPPLIQVIQATIPAIQVLASIITTVVVPAFEIFSSIIGGVASFVGNTISVMVNLVVGHLQNMGNLARGVWDAIKGIFNSTVGAIVRFVVDGISGLVRSVGQFFGDMGRAAQGGIGSLIGFVASIPGRILSAIGSLAGLLFSAGVDVVNGLIRGIGSVIGSIGKFLLNGVKGAVNSVLGFLGIKSPSRLFADIGRDMGLGMIVGLEKISPAVDSAAQAMAASATGAAQLSPEAAARAFGSIPTGGGGTAGTGQAGEVQVTLQQTNVMQPGTDVRQFASEVYRNGAYELAAASSLLGVSQGSPRVGIADIVTGARGTM